MTNAELAILGLIAEQPRHGYEIEHLIDTRGMREWTEIGFSSIYYLLRKLEAGGLVTSALHTGSGSGPARKVYTITLDGRAAHRAGVLTALAVPNAVAPALLLGLASWPVVTPDQGIAALRRYRDTLAERMRGVATRREEQQPLPPFVDAMFDYSQTLLEAEVGWIDRLIERLSRVPSQQGL